MVGAAGWSLPAVVASTTAGSVFGALIDYQVGRYLASTDRDTWLHRRLESETWRPRVAALCDRFRTHGPAFIIVNRFLPAIRGIFFVVAGMAGLRRGPVLAYAALSALIWNALIILLGYLVGFNLGRLVEIVRGYTNAVYVVLAVLGLAWLLWARHKRRKAGFGP
jgi:membrane protein DedA with SNARE-associated domain